MFKNLLFFITIWCAAAPANAQTSTFVKCTSADLDLTFELNAILQNVTNLNFNNEMLVQYWSDASINTLFPAPKSLSQIVNGAQRSEYVGVNFDRLKGLILVNGLNPPTKTQIKECQTKRDWGCEDWFVTETFKARCSIIDQKF